MKFFCYHRRPELVKLNHYHSMSVFEPLLALFRSGLKGVRWLGRLRYIKPHIHDQLQLWVGGERLQHGLLIPPNPLALVHPAERTDSWCQNWVSVTVLRIVTQIYWKLYVPLSSWWGHMTVWKKRTSGLTHHVARACKCRSDTPKGGPRSWLIYHCLWYRIVHIGLVSLAGAR